CYITINNNVVALCCIPGGLAAPCCMSFPQVGSTPLSLETDASSNSIRRRLERPKDRQKSAIGNGRLLAGVDERGSWVRRCKELLSEHIADLGGEANTSAAERSIVRRAAVLTTELERLEVKFALAGEASGEDIDLYARVASNLRRLLESVGLQRRAKNANPPTPDQYLARRTAAE